MPATLAVPAQRKMHPPLRCACCLAPATSLVKTRRACDGSCVRTQLACDQHAPFLRQEHQPGETGSIVTRTGP